LHYDIAVGPTSADVGLYAREDSEVVDILPTSARHRQCRPMMPITADLLPTSARHVVLSGLFSFLQMVINIFSKRS
jgi:hypothetical protein